MKRGEFTTSLTNYSRRPTTTVYVGQVPMGSEFPVRIQSMANTFTCDIAASVEQCIQLSDAGAAYVRLTVPSVADVKCLKQIRKELTQRGYDLPLIADVHFNPAIALEASAFVEKVRINPGNYGGRSVGLAKAGTDPVTEGEPSANESVTGSGTDVVHQVRKAFIHLLEACRKQKVALRIGVNHGSLSPRIMEKYGDSPEGMAESAMELLRICKQEQFDQVIVSMKSSNPLVMVHATRLVVHKMNQENMHYPVHLGVTEAGEGEDGRIRSAAGIAALLTDGIGDTIRISLTEDPVAEIPVAGKLINHLQDLARHESLPDLEDLAAGSFACHRRISRPVAFIGGTNVPVVIAGTGAHAGFEDDTGSLYGWHYSRVKGTWSFNDIAADLVFAHGNAGVSGLPATKGIILSWDSWKKASYDHTYPLMHAHDYLKAQELDGMLHFVRTCMKDLTDRVIDRLRDDHSAVMVYDSDNLNVTAEMRTVFSRLHQRGCNIPVVIRKTYHVDDTEDFMIQSAADLGGTLIDGLGDGLWLVNNGSSVAREVVTTAFRILQACRLRLTRTEYISCPSCGRTNFDLMHTVKKIREKTGHLKGLKIAVMGCIVNGPGEMADADYGYVGSGKGRITLYRSKEVIRRGIPEKKAVEELVNLIRESGDWQDQ